MAERTNKERLTAIETDTANIKVTLSDFVDRIDRHMEKTDGFIVNYGQRIGRLEGWLNGQRKTQAKIIAGSGGMAAVIAGAVVAILKAVGVM